MGRWCGEAQETVEEQRPGVGVTKIRAIPQAIGEGAGPGAAP